MRRLACVLIAAFMATAGHAQDDIKLAVGQMAPDFEVTDANGKTIKLSDRTKAGKHIALMFSRAKW